MLEVYHSLLLYLLGQIFIPPHKNREGMTIPPRKNRGGMTMGSHFFMRVAARRRRALATLMKKYEPMDLPSQFSVEVGLLW